MPAFDPSPNTPTTLSEPIVSGVMRKELGFKGLVYTDSMQMAGVTAMYQAGDAAVRAIAAGNESSFTRPTMRLRPWTRDAVKSGRIPEAQVNASVERILRAKAAAG